MKTPCSYEFNNYSFLGTFSVQFRYKLARICQLQSISNFHESGGLVEKNICVYFSKSHSISKISRFNKLSQSNFFICYCYSYNSSMISQTCTFTEPSIKLKKTYDCILDFSYQQGHSRNNESFIVFFLYYKLYCFTILYCIFDNQFFFLHSLKPSAPDHKTFQSHRTKLFLKIFDIKRIEISISVKFKSIIFFEQKIQTAFVFLFKILNKIPAGLRFN